VLIVWKLDRLGRSLPHLIEAVMTLEKRGVGFRSITEAIDTTTSSGRLVFHLFGALGQFERDLIQERTRAGLTAAAARGRKGGRKPVVNLDKLERARAIIGKGLTVREGALVSKSAKRRSTKRFARIRYNQMRRNAIDLGADADRERPALRREFRSALMSDTKWRKVFAALAGPECSLKQGIFQFFRAATERRMALPSEAMLADRWVQDSVEVGPYSYASILWLELPTQAIPLGMEQVPAAWIDQDITRARRAIEALGQMPVAETDRGLRVIGYLP
jgi:hypothetical protein